MTRPPQSSGSGSGAAPSGRNDSARTASNRTVARSEPRAGPTASSPTASGPTASSPTESGPSASSPTASGGASGGAASGTTGDASSSPAGLPPGAPALRTIAMPGDANPNGDIFGGWLLSQMDLAGSVVAYDRAEGRVATVAIDAMTFLQPVYIGDLVSCYATLQKTGRSSMRILVETFVRRRASAEVVKVTEGSFTYVAIDPNGRSRPLPGAPVSV